MFLEVMKCDELRAGRIQRKKTFEAKANSHSPQPKHQGLYLNAFTAHFCSDSFIEAEHLYMPEERAKPMNPTIDPRSLYTFSRTVSLNSRSTFCPDSSVVDSP